MKRHSNSDHSSSTENLPKKWQASKNSAVKPVYTSKEQEYFNYNNTRAIIESKKIELWNKISDKKEFYWPNDDVLREHLKFAIQQRSTAIAIELINTNVPLKDYLNNTYDGSYQTTYISEILEYSRNQNDTYALIAALLNNGYDINERYEDFYNTALGYQMRAGIEDHAKLLIANGAKFKHSYEEVVDAQTRTLESVRIIFEGSNNDYDETEVSSVGSILSSTIMSHYNNTQQVAEVNLAIGLAVGQHFDPEGGVYETQGNMNDSLDAQGCVTRKTILDQIRREISNSLSCQEFLSHCVYDRLTVIGSLLWSDTAFHTFGWNSVAEAKAAITQNPDVAQQIAERCIARLEEQRQSQQPGL